MELMDANEGMVTITYQIYELQALKRNGVCVS